MPNKKVRAWSSTNVRWMLANGRVRDARDILGQPHRVEGIVVHGAGRGHQIGFPTVNLGERIDGYIPVDGVYAGWIIDLDADEQNGASYSRNIPSVGVLRKDELHLGLHSPWRWAAAISVGTNPTFEDDASNVSNASNSADAYDDTLEEQSSNRTVEAYALTDKIQDLYGHRVCIEFARFLRPQQAFDSQEQLKDAISKDVEQTRALVAE